MRRLLVALVVLTVLPVPHASADPYAGYYLARGRLVEVFQAEGAPIEVGLFAADGEVVLDSSGEPFETGGCIDVFASNVLDSGCGELQVSVNTLTGTAAVTGTIDTVAYDYDPGTVTFTERGPSSIEMHLVLIGGRPRLGHSEGTGPGFCGLPPDISGAFLLAEILVDRDAAVSGSLTSATIGPVGTATLLGKVREGTYVVAGACL